MKKRNNEAEQPKPEPVAEVTDFEKTEFFKAMLTDSSFELAFPLLGGKLSVTFRALTVDENMMVFDQLKNDQSAGLITSDNNYLTSLTCYRLALAIKEINGVAIKDADIRDATDLVAVTKKIRSWPVFKVSAVTEAFKSFEDKVVVLTNAVGDQNFWTAVQ